MSTKTATNRPFRRLLRRRSFPLAILVLGFLIWFLAQRPSLNRDWQPGLDRCGFRDDIVHMYPIDDVSEFSRLIREGLPGT